MTVVVKIRASYRILVPRAPSASRSSARPIATARTVLQAIRGTVVGRQVCLYRHYLHPQFRTTVIIHLNWGFFTGDCLDCSGLVLVSFLNVKNFHHFLIEFCLILKIVPKADVECRSDTDCPLDKACEQLVCQDPCVVRGTVCGQNAVCRTQQHRPVCFCPDGWGGDPKENCFRRKPHH